MTWAKVVSNNVTRTQQRLPPSEQLPDGSWVTGFPNADAPTVEAAGWHETVDPLPAPDNGFEQILVWSWDGTVVTSTWVQGAAIPTPPPATDERLESFKAAVAVATTLTDVKEAAALWL